MSTTRFRIHRRTQSLLVALGLALTVWTSIVARETVPAAGLALTASLSEKTLTVTRGSETVKVYDVAVGTGKHPTPTGSYAIRKIVWNPAWVPPDQKWAEGKRPQGPGEPENPMKVVKIFFREPAYYIHGTGAVGSLGSAASHGCLRMDPDEAGELALMVMENAGVSRDWDWVKSILHLGESRTVALERPARLTIVP